MSVVVRVENVSKRYQLGKIGTQSLKGDLQRWWARQRGKEDPYGTVGQQRSDGSGEFWALKDVSFDIHQGEAVGIIGKNGAGKSTLLKILSRITLPTSGRVRVKGRIASLLEVGTGFNPDLTGRENIYLNGAILGMTKREVAHRFDEIVNFSGVEQFIDTPVKRYSSGMYVRLAFAVAAHLESEILILDEVLSVGDTDFQKKCLNKMDDVAHKEGRTVIFVSHEMAAVRSLCNRGVLLKKGGAAFNGNVDDAVRLYLTADQNQSADSINGMSLRDRTDRKGDGRFRFTDITFLNADYAPLEEVISGDPLVIKLDYQVSEPFDTGKLIIAVTFFDRYNNIVTSLLSDEMGAQFVSLQTKGSIYCKIPKLLLRGGRYTLFLWSSFNNTEPESALDVVENAASLVVLPGDFWGAGKVNRSASYLLMEGEFVTRTLTQKQAR